MVAEQRYWYSIEKVRHRLVDHVGRSEGEDMVRSLSGSRDNRLSSVGYPAQSTAISDMFELPKS